MIVSNWKFEHPIALFATTGIFTILLIIMSITYNRRETFIVPAIIWVLSAGILLILQKKPLENINIEEVLFCPHTPQDNCECRKPKTKLIEQYFTLDFDKNNSYVIGDRASDIELANNTGLKSVLVTTGISEKDPEPKSNPTFIAEDLLAAAIKIQNA